MVIKIPVIVDFVELGSSGDYIVAKDMMILDVIKLIIDINFTPNHPVYKRINDLKMFDFDRKQLCPSDKTIGECGLARGSKLFIV